MIKVALIGPDDNGIWKRTLNSELKTLFKTLADANIIEPWKQGRWQGISPAKPSDGLLLRPNIHAADLVVIYLTRNNLLSCIWAIGYAEAAEKRIIVLDAFDKVACHPRPARDVADFPVHDFARWSSDNSIPKKYRRLFLTEREHPIKVSAVCLARFILQHWDLYCVDIVPRGSLSLRRLKTFWTHIVLTAYQAYQSGDLPVAQLKLLGKVLSVYGCRQKKSTHPGTIWLALAIEYQDQQTCQALQGFMAKFKELHSDGSKVVHVYQNDQGVRILANHSPALQPH